MSLQQLFMLFILSISGLISYCDSLDLLRMLMGNRSKRNEIDDKPGKLWKTLAVKPFTICDNNKASYGIQSKSWRRASCISCLVPTSDLCQKTLQNCSKSSSEKIPIYQNLMEFGIDAGYFPKECTAFFEFPKQCSLKLEIKGAPEIFELKLFKCDGTSCKNIENEKIFLEGMNDSVSFVFKAFANGSVLIHATNSEFLATYEIITYAKPLFWIDKHPCQYDPTKDILHFSMTCSHVSQLYTSKSLDKFIGMPLILPCSSGGYAVDPATGKFATNSLYKEKVLQGINMNDVKNEFYNGLPRCARWPTQSPRLIEPAFLNKGKPKPYKEMKVQEDHCPPPNEATAYEESTTSSSTLSCKDDLTELEHIAHHKNGSCCCCQGLPPKLIRNNFFNFFYLGV